MRTLFFCVLSLLNSTVWATHHAPADHEQQATALIQRFASELRGELQSAMQQGGPVSAITVCQDIAPRLAAQLSAESGLTIGRTSEKIRNPANQADAWEQTVLADFARRHAAGEPVADLSFSAVVSEGESRSFRMMKAIGVEAPCLLCHGTQLAPDVLGQLNKLYPTDQATGYQLGDLRGAFTVTRPLD